MLIWSVSDDMAGHLLRPAGPTEAFYEEAHMHGAFIVCYDATFHVDTVLEEDVVLRALRALYRSVPVLRIHFAAKENELWIAEMEEETLDFQMLESSNVEEELMKVRDAMFESRSGPLWRARLVLVGKSSPLLPDVPTSFIHEYRLIFVFHHSIADGYSNVRMCDKFFRLLDDSIDGVSLDSSRQIGVHVPEDETEALISEIANEMRKDSLKWEGDLQEMEETFNEVPMLLTFLPSSVQHPEETTRTLASDIPKNVTEAFMKACRSHGVSVHSGITSLLNASLADCIAGAGDFREGDVIPVASYHFVDVRRFWKTTPDTSLGCHLSLLRKECKVPCEWKENFWELTRGFHTSFRNDLSEKACLKQEVLRRTYLRNRHYLANPMPPHVTFLISNLGDLSGVFSGAGRHLQVTKFFRHTSKNNFSFIMALYIHSFRGRLQPSLAFNTRYISRDVAQTIMNKFRENIMKVCSLR